MRASDRQSRRRSAVIDQRRRVEATIHRWTGTEKHGDEESDTDTVSPEGYTTTRKGAAQCTSEPHPLQGRYEHKALGWVTGCSNGTAGSLVLRAGPRKVK